MTIEKEMQAKNTLTKRMSFHATQLPGVAGAAGRSKDSWRSLFMKVPSPADSVMP
jgi:hypothetical protein